MEKVQAKLASLMTSRPRKPARGTIGEAQASCISLNLSTAELRASNADNSSDDNALGTTLVRCKPLPAECTSSVDFRSPHTLRVGERTFRSGLIFGADSLQSDVFEHVVPVLDRTLKGCGVAGAVVCYGASASGKSHSAFGPTNCILKCEEETGIASRVAARIFQVAGRADVSSGEVFIVEMSFLHVTSVDSTEEVLNDLLSEDTSHKLEVRQDPLSPTSHVCDGLRRVQARTVEEACGLISKGIQRRESLQDVHTTSSNCHSVLTFVIETLSTDAATGGLDVRRNKFSVVEASLYDTGARCGNIAALTNITLGAETSFESGDVSECQALPTLLRDHLNAGSALYIAHIRQEVESIDDDAVALSFAHLLTIASEATPGNNEMKRRRSFTATPRTDNGGGYAESDHSSSKTPSSITRMRQRHADCLRTLQEQIAGSHEEALAERQQIEEKISLLNESVSTQKAAEKMIQELQASHEKKIDDMRQAMTQSMAQELERLRSSMQMQSNEEMQSTKLQRELDLTTDKLQASENERSALLLKVAALEERSRARQDELQREITRNEEEKRKLHMSHDAQWQRYSSCEMEVLRLKSEMEAQRNEMQRSNAAREREVEEHSRQREAWRERESDLLRAAAEAKHKHDFVAQEVERWQREGESWRVKEAQLRGAVATAKRQHDEHVAQACAREGEARRQHEETADDLRTHLQRVQNDLAIRDARISALEHDSASMEASSQETQKRAQVAQEELAQLQSVQSELAIRDARISALEADSASMEASSQEAQKRAQVAQEELSEYRAKMTAELEDAQLREQELVKMLHEVQDGIIMASGANEHDLETDSD
eukprot:TRINITY_DN2360_c0_g2_i1.p1 TRINITY_DN2360_c0_g2~~TRINITY_DN2360_c0_g2_i1.p1  ORF type:complete len:856 (+),score=153.40 TRINITY_DN2360_c0_g2_i1:63-2570(+)